MPATTTFRALAGKCLDAYIELVLTSARGGEVDPDDALRIAMATGRGAPQLLADVETATGRFERFTAHGSRDWQAEIDQATEDYRKAVADAAVMDREFEELQRKRRALSERSQALIGKRSHLETSRREANNAYSRAMAADAGAGRDTTDWENFRLAD